MRGICAFGWSRGNVAGQLFHLRAAKGASLNSGIDKRTLSESDICDLFISPAIKDAGWDPMTQIRREVTLTPGPVIVRGNVASRNKKKKKFADYVLYREPGVPVAVVEAKDNHHTVSQGLQQALGYARNPRRPERLQLQRRCLRVAQQSCQPPEKTSKPSSRLMHSPRPSFSGGGTRLHRGIKDTEEPLVLQPYYEDASGKEPRYYQADAINRTIEAIAAGQKRVLLVMATGTGKTYTTFQIIWRLWKAGARQARSVSRRSQHPDRPGADQRLQAVRRRDDQGHRTQVRSGLRGPLGTVSGDHWNQKRKTRHSRSFRLTSST